MRTIEKSKVTCSLCGKEYTPESKTKYICPECSEKVALVKKLEMVDKAVKRLNKYRFIVSKYVGQKNVEPYADIVRENIRSGIDSFRSIPEVYIAIQLQRQGIRYETQKDIGGCNVDFCLPDMHIILEIDGSIYHTDDDKTFVRDRRLMAALDESWEIIHFDTENIPDCSWDLENSIPYIVSERNERYGFRNTTHDSDLLYESTSFLSLMKQGNKRTNKYAV